MNTHLYIHIPFCRSKCLYCDFYSIPGKTIPWGRFLDAVTAEAEERRPELNEPPETIYVGGGTPSLMPAEIATELLDRMKNIFGGNPSEITIELNPDDVTEEYIVALKETGYNRFSMGVQCFDDKCLRNMGRRHSAEMARNASALLTQLSNNVSLDLIFGLPEQTLEHWKNDVAQAMSLKPHHISCYALMLEEGTPLTRMVESGRISPPDEQLSAEMYAYLQTALKNAGYLHYEISNYALPGYESRHNSSYWKSHPYLGLGPGAHSYDGMSCRRFNPNDTQGYISRYASGNSHAYFIEKENLTSTDIRHEYLLTRLRTSRGISLENYKEFFGRKEFEKLCAGLQPLIDSRVMNVTSEGRIRIADAHWLTADPIIASLF